MKTGRVENSNCSFFVGNNNIHNTRTPSGGAGAYPAEVRIHHQFMSNHIKYK
jgi:hypothetical protein